MIKIQGSIPEKVLAKYVNKAHGTKPTGLTDVPINTPNFKSNRTPKGTHLAKRLEANNGFMWELYGAPLVARLPNGSMQIYDGGNRVATLQRIFPDVESFPALIVDVENESQIARLFHRINGTASQPVSPNVRFISQVLGKEEGLKDYIDVMKKTSVVVAESTKIKNYVLDDIINPKWRIDSNALIFLTDYNKATAITSLNLFTSSFKPNRGDGLQPVVSQVVKGIQRLLKTYHSEFFCNKENFEHFSNWFKNATEFDSNPNNWQFNEKYPHDRMEMRHLGTALGIVQKYGKYCRDHNKASPNVNIMKAQYQKRSKDIATRKAA